MTYRDKNLSVIDMNEKLKNIIKNMPSDWLKLTTHRLDIYNEELAKVEFLQKLNELEEVSEESLSELPTAFDYIRLGHPLSCLLEWAIACEKELNYENVISFSSQTMPLLAILRRNKTLKKNTRIFYKDKLPQAFDENLLKSVYAYEFELKKVNDYLSLESFHGSTVTIDSDGVSGVDFNLSLYEGMGSIVQVFNNDDDYVKEIQHVRRRESIAMTPHNTFKVLNDLVGIENSNSNNEAINKSSLLKTISGITNTSRSASIGNCGLSVQYSIMMGLVHYANENYKEKKIKFIVPPNCYGGTNDQARRVAFCIDNVDIIDLPVDSGKNMVNELERILTEVASEDAVPYIIAEIPTNPRVEIPDLEKLRETLKRQRETELGKESVLPVFILDQTFCPNVNFLGSDGYLHDVATISYVSGSKFPSGGLCTAGYCVGNDKAESYMSYVEKHLEVTDNRATAFQISVLTEQMPSMKERIQKAYENTRSFVDYIESNLEGAKINFVTHELAKATFTPSVFSLDLPTKGSNDQEREKYKRKLNHKLISMMIEAIPHESKHCVSYGQLKGCYWTIPATSTQGTTKESDKDYIVRVSIAADFDLEKHQNVFQEFCRTLN